MLRNTFCKTCLANVATSRGNTTNDQGFKYSGTVPDVRRAAVEIFLWELACGLIFSSNLISPTNHERNEALTNVTSLSEAEQYGGL